MQYANKHMWFSNVKLLNNLKEEKTVRKSNLEAGWYSVFELLADPDRYGDFVGHYVAYNPFPENTVCVFSEEETGYESEQRFVTESNGLKWQMSTDASREKFFLVADNSVDYELAVLTPGGSKLTGVSVNGLKDRIADLYSNKNLHLVD